MSVLAVAVVEVVVGVVVAVVGALTLELVLADEAAGFHTRATMTLPSHLIFPLAVCASASFWSSARVYVHT